MVVVIMTTEKLRRRPTMMICFEETGAKWMFIAFQTTNALFFWKRPERNRPFFVEMFSLNSAHAAAIELEME